MQSIGKDLQKAINTSDTIEVSKKDEVYLKVTCESSVAQELCDYFTFTVPASLIEGLTMIWLLLG